MPMSDAMKVIAARAVLAAQTAAYLVPEVSYIHSQPIQNLRDLFLTRLDIAFDIEAGNLSALSDNRDGWTNDADLVPVASDTEQTLRAWSGA